MPAASRRALRLRTAHLKTFKNFLVMFAALRSALPLLTAHLDIFKDFLVLSPPRVVPFRSPQRTWKCAGPRGEHLEAFKDFRVMLAV